MPDRADVVANLFTEGGDEYEAGDEVVLSVQWSDPSRTVAPTDPATGFTIVSPTTVACVVRRPDGTEVAPAPAVTLAGTVYSASLLPPLEPGQYWYGFSASGTFVGYAESSFVVRQTRA